MSFYDPYLQEAPQLPAHKNSYRASGMYGCTMGGYATPVHFILPTDAKEENQVIGIEFIQDMKSVAFSHFVSPDFFTDLDSDFMAEQEMDFFPITFGMNEKASMAKEELDNYFMNAFGKLWPGKADVPGKRVAVLIDGGPGQTNPEKLTKLRLMGILLFPSGPPNTTALLQIMDQLFGVFKTIFLQNSELLWQYLLSLPTTDKLHERIGQTYIGMLMFGGVLENGDVLQDAFNLSFSPAKKQKEWAKAGINPCTRAALKSQKI
jgi:hypothetical protein